MMEMEISTTPFGRRPLSHAMLAARRLAEACPQERCIDKWKLFRAACEGRAALCVSERALAVLNALLSFYPKDELSGAADLVVFPSNQQLALRAHGMAPATLRRHLGGLVEAGLILRRDSPNGKRYARKGQGGEIVQAFGFDLKPLVARAAEIEAEAEAVRAERRALTLAREALTLVRRDIVKMIEFALEQAPSPALASFHLRYADLAARIPRTATAFDLAPLQAEFARLRQDIANLLEELRNLPETNGNESQTECHKQNSKPDSHRESEPAFEQDAGSNAQPNPTRMERNVDAVADAAYGIDAWNDRHRLDRDPAFPTAGVRPALRTYPLGLVLEACPDIAAYAKGGVIMDWRDLMVVAVTVRAMLGISPSAYEAAAAIMGQENAAVVVAAILQRSASISSAGGYLRALTGRAARGEFSLGPVLMALLRSSGRERRRA